MATTTTFVKRRNVFELTVTLGITDTSSAKMFSLPKNARILQWVVNVVTAFATGTTELDIGTSSDGDYFVDGASLAAQGLAAIGTALKQPCNEPTTLTDIYMNVGASNTAGSVKATCLFSIEQDARI